MAALVASQSKCLVRRVGGMRNLLAGMRCMSSHDPKASTDHVYHEKGDQDGEKVWPDNELLFNPYDQMRFPFPGNTAPTLFHTNAPPRSTSSGQLNQTALDIDAILDVESRHQNQIDVVGQYSKLNVLPDSDHDPLVTLDVELKVQDCPLLMRKDFQMLFPGSDVMRGDFTVVSLCQRTENDMTGWSEGVEEERESLISLYSETAKEFCLVLRNAGFWADFIDPCSGKPYHGPHTTDVMFETDDRYRHFGFDIEDLGCCKVIKHHTWGTKSFVGCIFTNAPVDAPILVELTQYTETKSKKQV